VEYYFGYSYANSDLTCQDYRSRANMWAQSRYALDFFRLNNVPFQDMTNGNSRVSNNNWCLVERSVGRYMVVYLRVGGTATVDLKGLGSNPGVTNPSDTLVSVDWYDPKHGGVLQKGSVRSLQLDASSQSLGNAPSNTGSQQDWVVLLRCTRGC
jgi:Putative collagen-binding domain of a collagenase